MPSSQSTEPPRWGAFPSEQYLLQNWNSASEETDTDQRRRLIRDFVRKLDAIPEEWDTVFDPDRRDQGMVVPPSEAQISTILAPWRAPSLRLAAAKIGSAPPVDQLVWLRTHYARDRAARDRDDQNLRRWVETARDEDPTAPCDTFEEAWSCLVLNNDRLFDVGEDWSAVFDLVPEILGPFADAGQDSRRIPCDGAYDGAGSDTVATRRRRLRENLAVIDGYAARARFVDREPWLKSLCVRTALVVVDERAFATGGLLRIVFVDPRGNEVRSSRSMYDDNWWTLKADLCGGGLGTNTWWEYDSDDDEEEADDWHDGEKYRAGGEIGKVLYGVQDMLQEARLSAPDS
ncbi:hypothetical protein A9K55_009089 [Cordyceps militaris]|uniref:Uncharacterized protein n=1 Tax=Cordyceps militaris TaxID=73501 RepID=A0A2H4SJZ2_CORMI|nr:hypothetical protein A9K55_009089 [Cordyceps militaris]